MTAPPGPLVGLVVVSHSRALADAAVALAREMVHDDGLRIAVAAGLDETTFGTDAAAILDALLAADTGAGSVVLMDLGSAVLSAELALELLDDDARARVLLCPAPLVEGLVVAAVTAAGGADRDTVAAEAAGALAGKQSQLGAPAAPAAAAGGTVGPAAGFVVADPHGLHARPAARLVAAVRGLDADVALRNATTGSDWVPAASLSRVATLGALAGHRIEVRAEGPGAAEAVAAVLAAAAAARLSGPDAVGDGAAPVGPAGVAGAADVAGRGAATSAGDPVGGGVASAGPVGASPGVALGPVRQTRRTVLQVPDLRSADPDGEWAALAAATSVVRAEITVTRGRAAAASGEDEAAIFDAHLMLLDDPDLLADVRTRIEDGHAAAPAWAGAVRTVADRLAALPGEYLRARAADVTAVGDQVLRVLLGAPATATATAAGEGILVAADLTPADAAALDPATVRGVVLASGSPTAHAAILLRAKGVPAVVGAGPAVLEIADGTVVALDGGTGELHVDPPEAVRAAMRDRAAAAARRGVAAAARAGEPARTRDGVEVLVGVNVGSVADAAAATGADLAGLVRTEFLFLGRDAAPGVEEQEAAYRAIAAALGGRRITLRTFDIGGDKPLSYVPMPAEANPYLGVRGLRLALARPELFTDQLRAVVRTARATPVSVMFPMVATVAELIAARRMLDDVIAEGGGRPDGLQVGIMVEVPAAALKTAAFAPHVDFLSIGTNDLTQYALAAERGNPALAAVADGLDPGVLRLVHEVCAGAGPDVLVAVCGELAADPDAAALLVGLGVRELSVAGPAVAGVKEAVRAVSAAAMGELAAAALAEAGPDGVRALLTSGTGA